MSSTTTVRAGYESRSQSSTSRPLSRVLTVDSSNTSHMNGAPGRSLPVRIPSAWPTMAAMQPPPLDYEKSPYACVPLPPQSATNGRVALHPMLQSQSVGAIQFDLASPPPQGSAMAGLDLSRLPATSPSLPSMTIISPSLPWGIIVHGSSCFGSTVYVSIIDVWRALYRALDLLVTPAEFHSAMAPLATRNKASAQQVEGLELRGPRCYWAGMRRLHFLRGRQTFKGLEKSAVGVETWVLVTQ